MLSKTSFPIIVFFETATFVSLEYLNAHSSISVTLSGMTTDFNPDPLNAESLILVTLFGMFMDFKLQQDMKVP